MGYSALVIQMVEDIDKGLCPPYGKGRHYYTAAAAIYFFNMSSQYLLALLYGLMKPGTVSAFQNKIIDILYLVRIAQDKHTRASQITTKADRFIPSILLNITDNSSRSQYMPGITKNSCHSGHRIELTVVIHSDKAIKTFRHVISIIKRLDLRAVCGKMSIQISGILHLYTRTVEEKGYCQVPGSMGTENLAGKTGLDQ